MRKFFLSFILFFLSLPHSLNALESPPQWVTGLGRDEYFSYPRFITGYAVLHVKEQKEMGDAINSARQSACTMLVSSLKSTLTVRSRLESQHLNSGSNIRITEELSSTIIIEGALELQNLGTEVFYDKKRKNVHVLVWIEREKQILSISSRLSSSVSLVKTYAVLMRQHISSGEFDKAAKTYSLAIPLLTAVKRECFLLELFGGEAGVWHQEYIETFSLFEQLNDSLNSSSICAFEAAIVFEAWAGAGSDSICQNESYRLSVNASSPLYLRILCKLENGLTLIPDPMYKNFFLNGPLVNYPLPGLFHLPQTLGAVSIEILVSTEPFDELEISVLIIDAKPCFVVTGKPKINASIRRHIPVVKCVE
ncbi:MAG: hypothetical protein LBB56_03460 [Chitinispirillales bacterium]|jgi:hypothetical protein|nr:hypothetical protein [Chitinispirillales bacterium]